MLGKVIKFHRKKAALSQLGLARIAGVGKTVVFDIEKGKASVRFVNLQRVLQALNIKLNWDSPLKLKFFNGPKLSEEA